MTKKQVVDSEIVTVGAMFANNTTSAGFGGAIANTGTVKSIIGDA